MSRISFFLLIIIIFNSCVINQKSRHKTVNDNTTLIDLMKSQNHVNQNPEWLLLKGRINITNLKSETDLKFTLKSKTDSAVLISITALLGFEIFKAKITPDSVFFINRLNKTVYSRSFQELQNQIKIKILYSDLINILTSNQIILKDIYEIKNTETNYYLESETAKYVIDGKSKKIISSNVYFNNTEKKIFCEFLNYKKIKTYLIANKISLQTKEISVKLEYEKIILDEPQRMVFKIPDNYVKK